MVPGIWWSCSFEKIGASETTACHLGNLVSLTDHCDLFFVCEVYITSHLINETSCGPEQRGADVPHEGIWWFSSYEEIQGLGSWNQFLEIPNCLNTCSTRSPGTQGASLHPELSQGVLKVNSYSSTGFNLCRGRWQMPCSVPGKCSRQVPICSWQEQPLIANHSAANHR